MFRANVIIAQANNPGNYSASACVPNGAGIATSLAATTTGILTITPVGAGTCTITVTGTDGQTAPIAVTVTTTSVTQAHAIRP